MKSRKRIICDNLFTLFNFLNFAIAGLLFAVGAYKNMLFLGVIILNIIIGTAQELVKAMKRQGHQVAMTGDGVNDLLALREADCSIAVADGSDASRRVAQVVLLESDFTQLPQVVMEFSLSRPFTRCWCPSCVWLSTCRSRLFRSRSRWWMHAWRRTRPS